MSHGFFDRAAELARLREINRRKAAQFIAVHGRRRIGKTSLLVHWMESEPMTRSVYWVAHRSTSAALLGKFSRAVQPLIGTRDPGFTFSDWEAALEAVADLAAREPLILVIDELPYLLECAPSFATVLQAAWDRRLKHSRLRLVVSGSHVHMMQTTLGSPKGPLYGRTTADLMIGELSIRDMVLFLPGYSTDQLVETYSVIGGVPRYLESWSDRRPVLANIHEEILSPVSIFQNEPAFLIHDEIADPRTYLALLEAIGVGMRRPVDIARVAGVKLAHVGKYLRTLESLRFVRRIVSVDAPSATRSRNSHYEIRDPYLRFHFMFIQPNLRLLEQERLDRLMDLIRAGFDAHVGRTGYEEICRRHVATLADRNALPFQPLEIGRMWDRRVELDLVALDRRSRVALVGECRWRSARTGVEVLEDLQHRAAQLKNLRGFKLHYALFSRKGFTSELANRARRERVRLIAGVPEDGGL